MKFNVLKHDLVPEHHVLKPEETKVVLEQYGIQIDQLPKIRNDDPCIQTLEKKYGEIEPGTLIKIVRRSDSAGVAVTYRVVVKASMTF